MERTHLVSAGEVARDLRESIFGGQISELQHLPTEQVRVLRRVSPCASSGRSASECVTTPSLHFLYTQASGETMLYWTIVMRDGKMTALNWADE